MKLGIYISLIGQIMHFEGFSKFSKNLKKNPKSKNFQKSQNFQKVKYFKKSQIIKKGCLKMSKLKKYIFINDKFSKIMQIKKER